MSNQKAGGYLVDVSRSINGQPEYVGYDDFKPPCSQWRTFRNQDGGGYYVDIGGDNIEVRHLLADIMIIILQYSIKRVVIIK